MDFASVQNIREYDGVFDEAYPAVIELYVRVDSRYIIYYRQVYTILEFLGDVGGLQQMLFIIGMLLVTFFARRQFFSSIIKEVY
jgi:hypothetical protein